MPATGNGALKNAVTSGKRRICLQAARVATPTATKAQLNPVEVWAIAAPTTIDEVQDALKRATKPAFQACGLRSYSVNTAAESSSANP